MATDLRQTHFRFGKDDGTEVSHTWWQNEDTDHTQIITGDWTFLLRFTEQEVGGTAAANTDAQFQYNKNGAGWVDITTSSSVVKAVAVNAFTNGQDCTKRLSGTGTFEASGDGCTEDGLSGGPQNDIAASGNSETECGLQIINADVANGDTIQFRFRSPDWTVTYVVTPTLTILKGGIQYLAGVVNGLASVTGITKASRRVVGVSACLTTVNGITKVSRKLTGVVTCIGTTTGIVRVSKKIAGLVSGVASVAGNLIISLPYIFLAGVTNGIASITGAIKITRKLSGSIAGTSLVSGVLNNLYLAGAINGVTSVLGKLGRLTKISSAIAGLSSVMGKIGITHKRILNLNEGGLKKQYSLSEGGFKREFGLTEGGFKEDLNLAEGGFKGG